MFSWFPPSFLISNSSLSRHRRILSGGLVSLSAGFNSPGICSTMISSLRAFCWSTIDLILLIAIFLDTLGITSAYSSQSGFSFLLSVIAFWSHAATARLSVSITVSLRIGLSSLVHRLTDSSIWQYFLISAMLRAHPSNSNTFTFRSFASVFHLSWSRSDHVASSTNTFPMNIIAPWAKIDESMATVHGSSMLNWN